MIDINKFKKLADEIISNVEDEMKKTKKSFGQIWSELTSEQVEYLRDYINKQKQDAVKEYIDKTFNTKEK